jgi:hypothetical protein
VGPAFSCDQQTAGIVIIGNAVENIGIDQDSRLRVEARQIDPSDDLPVIRADDRDEVRLLDIRVEMPIGKF